MTRLALDNPATTSTGKPPGWLSTAASSKKRQDETNPLLERLKFLAISASNLDEFFEVRVAGLVQQIEDGYTEAGPDGLTLVEERDVASRETYEFVDDQYRCWNDKLRPHSLSMGSAFWGSTNLMRGPAPSSKSIARRSSTYCLRRSRWTRHIPFLG